jgi:hypothetical protein
VQAAYATLDSGYQVAAIYVSLAALLLGCRSRPDVVVFGFVNPFGYLGSDWGWSEEMLELCERLGVRRAVVAQGTRARVTPEVLRQADAVLGDKQPRLEIIEVGPMLEALPLCLELAQASPGHERADQELTEEEQQQQALLAKGKSQLPRHVDKRDGLLCVTVLHYCVRCRIFIKLAWCGCADLKAHLCASCPIIVSSQGLYFPAKASLLPGRGEFRAIGGLRPVAEESFRVAFTFVNLRASMLAAWVAPGTSAGPLLPPRFDLQLDTSDHHIWVDGPSASAAGALAMVMLLTKCDLLSNKLAITGKLDLRGRILSVADIDLKVAHGKKKELTVMVPAVGVRQLQLSPELQGSFKEVDTFVDILEFSIPGEPRARITPIWCATSGPSDGLVLRQASSVRAQTTSGGGWRGQGWGWGGAWTWGGWMGWRTSRCKPAGSRPGASTRGSPACARG